MVIINSPYVLRDWYRFGAGLWLKEQLAPRKPSSLSNSTTDCCCLFSYFVTTEAHSVSDKLNKLFQIPSGSSAVSKFPGDSFQVHKPSPLFMQSGRDEDLLNKSYLKFLGQTIHELLHYRKARITSYCSRYYWHKKFQAPYFTGCFSAFLSVYSQINYPPSGDYTCDKLFRIWSEESVNSQKFCLWVLWRWFHILSN